MLLDLPCEQEILSMDFEISRLLPIDFCRRRRLPERDQIIDRKQFDSDWTGRRFKDSKSKGHQPTRRRRKEQVEQSPVLVRQSIRMKFKPLNVYFINFQICTRVKWVNKFHPIHRPCKQAGRKEGEGAGRRGAGRRTKCRERLKLCLWPPFY